MGVVTILPRLNPDESIVLDVPTILVVESLGGDEDIPEVRNGLDSSIFTMPFHI